ncbi:hypothetical protein [Burkholderia ambifaria]|uniref:hypothetical protein n=1 Tax=Burkholderia ambifaria TaxID=152480 RepID=UPI00158D49CE|nr:hypothetical protein [Burkholderia ambifaria]
MNELKGLLRYYRYCPRMLALHFVSALMAWFAPEDILARYQALGEFASYMENIFPVIGEAIVRSAFPEVTGLYFAIMYVFLPLRIIDSTRAFYADRDKTFEKIRGFFWKRIFASIGVVVFFGFGVVTVLFGRPYYEINVIPISKSRFLLGLVGPLFAGGAEAFGIAVGFVWIFIFVSWVLSKIRG